MKRVVWMGAVVTCVIAVVVSFCAPAGAEPVVFDEGFESGRGAWKPAGVGSIDTAHSDSGEASVRIEDDDPGAYCKITRSMTLEPEKRYQLSFWAFTGDPKDASVVILQQDADGQTAVDDGGRRLVTGLLRPGEHRVGPSCIPVGTEDGTVYVLPAHGS